MADVEKMTEYVEKTTLISIVIGGSATVSFTLAKREKSAQSSTTTRFHLIKLYK